MSIWVQYPNEYPSEYPSEYPTEYTSETLSEYISEYPSKYPSEYPSEYLLNEINVCSEQQRKPQITKEVVAIGEIQTTTNNGVASLPFARDSITFLPP